jgi:general secretion pathway protein F
MAPIFDYKAVGANGKNQKGMVEAESPKSARSKLKKQGLLVTEITEKTAQRPSGSGGIPFIGNRVSAQEVSMMTRQLASLVKANIPLVEALAALVSQTENQKLKVVLAQVRQDVNQGSSLAKATGAHPKIFDHIFVNMIEAGESSGTLSIVLVRLAELKEAQMRLRSKVISGMTYPVLMMFVAFSLMLAIFTFVIPKLMKIFDSMNKPVPTLTRVLMGISDSLVNWWFLWAGLAAIITVAFRKYIHSEAGRPKWDAFTLRVPIAGPLVRMIAVTRFSSTMATLLQSGVPIITAMTIARNLVGNVPIANAIASAKENITEGQSIADPLRRSGEFPPMMIHMISIGEKTGELPEMLQNIAETYEDQVNTKIETLTSLLEPLMIVGMGFSVGFIVLSVFMPLMEMMNINQR